MDGLLTPPLLYICRIHFYDTVFYIVPFLFLQSRMTSFFSSTISTLHSALESNSKMEYFEKSTKKKSYFLVGQFKPN